MQDTKRVLIVSPYFPPSTLAGVHRARHLTKHLPATGWQPIVLCVHERFHEERLDPELAGLVPSDAEVIKIKAFPAPLIRRMGVGDLSLRAFYQLRSALRQILETRRIDVVLITGSPFYPMLLSGWLRRRYGRPIVLDFQDPWVSAFGAAQPLLSKGGVTHWLSTQLEPIALRSASFVTSVSDVQNKEMADRYPWFDAAKMVAIPIGGDPEDYQTLRAGSRTNGHVKLAPGYIHFSYVGTFLPRSEPAARTVLTALAELRKVEPALAEQLRFNFVGTSNQTDNTTLFQFRPLAEACGVADLIQEIPQRVPFLNALDILANSSALLLLGSDEPHYTASKIYPALLSGRPFLSLFHKASSAHCILTEASGGFAFSFSNPEELALLAGPISTAIRNLAINPEAAGQLRHQVIAPYAASSIAARFAEILETVSRES